jgi:transposase
MGTKRDPQTLKELERRRRLAAELLRRGVRPAEVARWVASSRQSVMRWSRLLEQDGLRGLRRATRIGRPPRLTDRHLEQLAKRLKVGTVANASRVWTLPRIRRLIEREFGVRLSISSVWRTLQRMGWSVHRAANGTRPQSSPAVMQWTPSRGSIPRKT